jgi:hypothetical protein
MGAAEGRLRDRALLGLQPERLLLQETFELFLEAGKTAAAVDEMLLAASPGRMRLRIDIEMQRIAGLAPGRAGRELRAVSHNHLDEVVVGVRVRFHGSLTALVCAHSARVLCREGGGSIAWRDWLYKREGPRNFQGCHSDVAT